MIYINKIKIREFRGIRDLSLDLNGRNFATCGPNGTGKSGIVDAIEFALTGNISRLAGAGTGGLSVKHHGPHVDSRDKPDQASVTLELLLPSLNAGATIQRTVKNAEARRYRRIPRRSAQSSTARRCIRSLFSPAANSSAMSSPIPAIARRKCRRCCAST